MHKSVKETYINVLFKIVYLVHLFLSLLVYTAGNKISLILLLICGVIIGVYRIVHIKEYLKFHSVLILTAFMISYIISNLIFVRYGVMEQFQMLVWMGFQFFLLYTINLENKVSDIYKEMKIVFYTMIVLSTVVSAIGLGTMLANYATVVKSIDGRLFLTGLTPWGRLYGIYNEINYASVFTLVCIFLSHMLLKQNNKLTVKVCLVCSNVIQILFIIFGQSRTAQVCIVMASVVLLICKTLEDVNKKNIIKNSVIGLIVVVISFGGFPKVVTLYNSIDFDLSSSIDTDETEQDSQEDPKIEMGRDDILTGDISNRRFDLWRSSLDFIKNEPIVGVGNRNIVAYAEEYLPNTYLIANDSGAYDAFHNTVVDVAVSQGIVGILILLILVFCILKFIVGRWKCLNDKDKHICSYLLAIEVMIAGSAMFLSHIFYVNILTTYCFWLILGYLIFLLSKANLEKEI
ncbi:MAG: O-antigen ligase family protein [Tyzzerella sp.]|nr:O-antigen ligase family protein [Tyzzerella sp.]